VDSHEYSGCGVEFGSRSHGQNLPLRLPAGSCNTYLSPRTGEPYGFVRNEPLA